MVRGYLDKNIIGTPDDAIEKLAEIEESGVGGVIFMAREWAGVKASRRSWRLFAEEVAPKLRYALEVQGP